MLPNRSFCNAWKKKGKCLVLHNMVAINSELNVESASEKLSFKFYLILINLNLSGDIWLVSP